MDKVHFRPHTPFPLKIRNGQRAVSMETSDKWQRCPRMTTAIYKGKDRYGARTVGFEEEARAHGQGRGRMALMPGKLDAPLLPLPRAAPPRVLG
jgi:hypothetical protein